MSLVPLGWAYGWEEFYWGGGTTPPSENSSGVHLWETATNWTDDTVPVNSGSNDSDWAFIVPILDGDLLVTTPEDGWTVGRLSLGRGFTSEGVFTFRLGGDFVVRSAGGTGNSHVFIDNNGTSAEMVVDLNGYLLDIAPTYSVNSDHLLGGAPVTIMSSQPGGEIVVRRFASDSNLVIGAGVTIRKTNTAGISSVGTVWDPTSRLIYGGSGNTITGTSNFSNLELGWAESEDPTWVRFEGQVTVARDLTIHMHENGGSTIRYRQSGGRTTFIGRHFTDQVAEDIDYEFHDESARTGDRVLVFNGYNDEVGLIDVARTGITSNFRVGNGLSERGNVQLVRDLHTNYMRETNGELTLTSGTPVGGRFTVQEGSTFDVSTYTLHAREFVLDAATEPEDRAVLRFGIGGDGSGLVHVTENYFFDDETGDTYGGFVTLHSFVLDLVWTGVDIYNQDVVLFQFDGAFTTGTLDFELGEIPEQMTYDGLFLDEGEGTVYLSNVVIPEPGWYAAVFLGLAVVGVAWRRRRGR